MTEFGIGCRKLEQGKNEEAEIHFEECARHCPEAWLGVACEDLRDGKIALASLRLQQVIRHATFHKTRAVALNNLGMLLNNNGNRSASEPLFVESFRLWKMAETATNLALCYQYSGQMELAGKWLDKAILMDPGNHTVWFNKALLCLLQGDFKNGFRHYLSRWKNPQSKTKKLAVLRPEWTGQPLHGKTLLVYAEQGAGDTIQMLRYGPMIKAKGCKLLLAPQIGIAPLAARQGCWDEIYEDILQRIEHGNVPAYDYQVPAMNLPHIFGTTLENIPPAPYLSPPFKASRIELPAGRLNIGFCWAGSPDHSQDLWRSTNLDDWKPLFEIPGTRWHSLQVGPRIIELIGMSGITDCAPSIRTYDDSAALIDSLDLIVSVDTSLVHLAGALGKPIWMLTPYSPDWRWMLNRDDSPWYSSLRLFRQTKELQWSDVFERIKDAIQSLDSCPARLDAGQLVG